jgi:polyisoprenoid-binding protein YceI
MTRFLIACGLLITTTAAVAAATAAPASAPTATPVWQNAPGSTLSFASSYDGEAFEGHFARFDARIAFDPAGARGQFDVRIILASAGTENDERDDTLKGSDFFNIASAAQARYQASRFRKLADGRFVADGTLTLRGISKPVPLTFTWTAGAMPVLAGSAVVKRLEFGVGSGDWSDTAVLPDAVTVRTRLVLQPRK